MKLLLALFLIYFFMIPGAILLAVAQQAEAHEICPTVISGIVCTRHDLAEMKLWWYWANRCAAAGGGACSTSGELARDLALRGIDVTQIRSSPK